MSSSSNSNPTTVTTTTSASAPASQKDGTNLVQGLITALSGALVYTDAGNVETNKRLWNRYADEWQAKEQQKQDDAFDEDEELLSNSTHGSAAGDDSASPTSIATTTTTTTTVPSAWVAKMAANTAKTSKATGTDTDTDPFSLSIVGQEWSTKEDLLEVLQDFIFPYITPDSSIVAEVGVGGGRAAAQVLGHCASLTCLDISASMLGKAKAALSSIETKTKLEFLLLDSPTLDYPTHLHNTFDFLYCFDVLVHVDLHSIYKTLQQIHHLLKPGAKAFLSVANLLTPAGWRRFAVQNKYSVGGFYFISPDILLHLLKQTGLKVVKTSQVPVDFKELTDEKGPANGNLYYGRDFLVVVEK